MAVPRQVKLVLFLVLLLVLSGMKLRLLLGISDLYAFPLPDATPALPPPFHPPEWNDGGPIDPASERERCRRHGYAYVEGRTVRRRLFFGSLLADDSDLLIRAFAAESRNVYHAVAYVEGAETAGGFNRTVRYPPGSSALRALAERLGPRTAVSVDQIPVGWLAEVLPRHDTLEWKESLVRENTMRQRIFRRWAKLGMRADDVGVLGDADEVFTRDFLRAAQICDVPEFRPGQDCRAPKVLAKGLIFEASPECIVADKLLWHPDMILGECLEHIGDEQVHLPPKRDGLKRASGHGGRNGTDYDEYLIMAASQAGSAGNRYTHKGPMYPLWSAADVRATVGGGQHQSFINGTNLPLHTAYHLHNFFGSTEELRFKYLSYAEGLKGAQTDPLAQLHDDLSLAVSCVRGEQNLGKEVRIMGGFDAIQGPRPILFDRDQELVECRHEAVRRMIFDDEKIHGAVLAMCISGKCEVVGEYHRNATSAG